MEGAFTQKSGRYSVFDGFFVLLGLGCCGALADLASAGYVNEIVDALRVQSDWNQTDSGGNGGNAWRIVGSTNGGATNVLFFLCWYLF